MALNLHTVQGLVTGVRVKLQDRVQPYRYSDNAIVSALNIALLQSRGFRPDLFLVPNGGFVVPQYDAPSGQKLPFDAQFRPAFEFGTAAHVLYNDVEDVQDERANSFNNIFHDMLQGKRPNTVQGGTPPAAKSAS